MTLPTPKFQIGDRVFAVNITTEARKQPCPDCMGKETWHLRSPAGAVYEAPCPRCSDAIHRTNACLRLDYREHVPFILSLTIGSVRLDTHSEKPVSYMCEETGVGSGSVWYEDQLFECAYEAQAWGEAEATRLNESVSWIRDLYEGSLEFCDYELRPAVAEYEKAEVARLKWKIQDIKSDVRGCIDMEDVRALVAAWDEDE